MDELDEFCQGLQIDIDKKVEETYGKKIAEIWKNLKYFNVLEKGDGIGKLTGSCGDSVEILIKVKNGKIDEISYWTDGCIATVVCGSLVCDLAHGKPLEEAEKISGEDVLTQLPGLPEDHHHCAFLAANTLHEAIGDYYRKIQNQR